jgi:hypothetical protein
MRSEGSLMRSEGSSMRSEDSSMRSEDSSMRSEDSLMRSEEIDQSRPETGINQLLGQQTNYSTSLTGCSR